MTGIAINGPLLGRRLEGRLCVAVAPTVSVSIWSPRDSSTGEREIAYEAHEIAFTSERSCDRARRVVYAVQGSIERGDIVALFDAMVKALENGAKG